MTEVSLIKKRATKLPVRYLLVVWLGVLSGIAYLDRTNVSIASIEFCKEFVISKIRLGWIASAFLVGYAGFQIPAGLLARRLGPRRTLAWLGMWWACCLAVIAFLPAGVGNALLVFIVVRFVLGAGEATMYPAASQFVERWFPAKERGRANSIIFAGVGMGSVVSFPLVTRIILHHGWRASFGFTACMGALVGLIWFIAARDTPEQHSWVGDGEQSLIVAGRRMSNPAARGEDGAGYGKHAIPWAKIFRDRNIFALTVSYFSFAYVAWMFFAWIYIYMAQVRGLNLKTSAIYSMFPFIAMTVGCLLGGVVSDWIAARFGLRIGRCLLPGIALALTAILLLLGSSARDSQTAALVLASAVGILYLAQSNFWAVSADIAGEYTGIVSGMMNMGGQIGGACTASLTPWIAAHYGWNMAFVVAGALVLIGSLAWVTIDPNRLLVPTPAADQ